MEERRSKVALHHHHVQKERVVVMRPSFKRVDVVYYLSRNGHLEHPHYMEVTHLANLPLRLKDVMDRLTVLRGKGMPSLYSWSCKRSYKNGYVWNDLGENDVIYPSEGAEYVLKGSELIEGSCTATEKLQHLQVGNNVAQFQTSSPSNLQPKRKSIVYRRRPEPEEMVNNNMDEENADEQEEEEETCYARRSRAVSTDNQIEVIKQHGIETRKNATTEFTFENGNTNSFSSPPSTATSSTSLSDKANNETTTIVNNNNNSNDVSERFEDGDPLILSRNSMLFNLIACGGLGSFRKSSLPPPSPCSTGRKSGVINELRKGVLMCNASAAKEDEDMIRCMSENPRFGNLMAEEKEYFSGSIIVDTISTDQGIIQPAELKKSSSYNEQRSCQSRLGEAADDVEEVNKKEKGVKAKCIPRMMSSSSIKPSKN